ncbi:hypothetical protein NKH16_17050 [Mesorhizobium sp. M1307]|uniref:hypothetical protein n=1 Tax=unclassified Mesorhizobium TaxID=325217 RepID=UPI00333BF4EF
MTIPLPDNALVALKEPAPPGAAGKEAVIAAEGRQCKGAPLYQQADQRGVGRMSLFPVLPHD